MKTTTRVIVYTAVNEFTHGDTVFSVMCHIGNDYCKHVSLSESKTCLFFYMVGCVRLAYGDLTMIKGSYFRH